MTKDSENAFNKANQKWSEDDVSPTLSRFHIFGADEFSDGPDRQYLIDGVAPDADIVMITGASGAAKTFFSIDMVASIALNKQWRGRNVQQGRVIYIAAEGADGVRKRLKAYKKYHNVKFDNSFGVITDAPDLRNVEDINILADSINRNGGARVVVLDTLAQTTPGANENSSEDMGKVMSHCKSLRKATGALIILIHHTGKDETRGARGWSGMKAAMDAEIEIKRINGKRIATITKQKDGEEGAVFAFTLEPVYWEDSEGNTISSCVVKYDETLQRPKGPKLAGKWQQAVYKAVENLTILEKNVSVRDVINEAIKSEPYDGDEIPQEPTRDRRRETVRRAISEMAKAGLIEIENNRVSLPQNRKMPQVD